MAPSFAIPASPFPRAFRPLPDDAPASRPHSPLRARKRANANANANAHANAHNSASAPLSAKYRSASPPPRASSPHALRRFPSLPTVSLAVKLPRLPPAPPSVQRVLSAHGHGHAASASASASAQRAPPPTPQPDRAHPPDSARAPAPASRQPADDSAHARPAPPASSSPPAPARDARRSPDVPPPSSPGSTKSAAASAAAAAGQTTAPAHVELLVLVHGLQGAVEDFSYLLDTLRSSSAHTQGRLIVHATRVNTDRTHDGIDAGGARLAADVRAVVAQHPQLTHISFLGFSLGGMYVRYAVAQLYRRDARTVAGLTPRAVVLVATPNLGVRRFGVYRFVPEPLRAFPVLGFTGRQLMLADGAMPAPQQHAGPQAAGKPAGSMPGTSLPAMPNFPWLTNGLGGFGLGGGGGGGGGGAGPAVSTSDLWTRRKGESSGDREHSPSRANASASGAASGAASASSSDPAALLVRMARDGDTDDTLFVSALAAFPDRVLYANLRNDFMVNYGTAALDETVTAVSGPEVERVVRARVRQHVDGGHDERGCRICFRFRAGGEELRGRGVGSDNGARRDEPEPEVQPESKPEPEAANQDDGEVEDETVMARRLRSLGWWVVGIDFPVPVPIAHNRIVAMSRNAIHSWMNAPGRRAVHHLVDTLVAPFDEQDALFRVVRDASGEPERARARGRGRGGASGGGGDGAGVPPGAHLRVGADDDSELPGGSGVAR